MCFTISRKSIISLDTESIPLLIITKHSFLSATPLNTLTHNHSCLASLLFLSVPQTHDDLCCSYFSVLTDVKEKRLCNNHILPLAPFSWIIGMLKNPSGFMSNVDMHLKSPIDSFCWLDRRVSNFLFSISSSTLCRSLLFLERKIRIYYDLHLSTAVYHWMLHEKN